MMKKDPFILWISHIISKSLFVQKSFLSDIL